MAPLASWLPILSSTILAITVCCTLSITAAVLYTVLLVPYQHWAFLRKQGLRGPPFRPVLGQLPELRASVRRRAADPKYAARVAAIAEDDIALYGKVCISQMLGPDVRLVLADPAAIKEVLGSKAHAFAKPPDVSRDFLEPLGPTGLILSDGVRWAASKKMLNPAFYHERIKAMSHTMTACTSDAVDRWMKSVATGSQEVDMYKELSKLSFCVIARTAFGIRDAGTQLIADQIFTSVERFCGLNVKSVLSGMAFIGGYRQARLPTPLNRKIDREARTIRRLGLRLIKPKQAEGPGKANRDNILDIMLAYRDEATGAKLTDDQLLDQCMTFLLAGHDTTGALMTWTLYLLLAHPDYYKKARDEVLEVLGKCDSDAVPSEALPKLKMLHWILQESMRLFPPVPMMVRKAIKDTQIGDILVPKGLNVAITVYPVHVDKAIWGDDAAEFRPERFANGVSGAVKHSAGFIPFSTGPRYCIGQNFALTEAKIVLAKLLSAFSMDLSPKYRHVPTSLISLRPRYGLPVLLTRRAAEQPPKYGGG
ncbi:cytochrome P450 [Klebsormidium nitens]|uniref:Cytochrome P450 n=1 Tax=Klebsormidium nitens TaxID=105231 RepID=A0A1Y1HML7_KLENI|nr:cytochrome P450 [Klebsormidium nitens]|eukprot:GAQ78241.1 cytochrome P450 [Klebsormidium nitens]